MRDSYLFTSESVSEGHPDKVSDQISDAVVDLFLSKDKEARVACETLTTTQRVVLAGEIRCRGVYENDAWAEGALDEIERTVRGVVKDIGYEQKGFHWANLRVDNFLHGQSEHIAQGVDGGQLLGQDHRVALGQDEDAGAQADALGHGGHPGEPDQRIGQVERRSHKNIFMRKCGIGKGKGRQTGSGFAFQASRPPLHS